MINFKNYKNSKAGRIYWLANANAKKKMRQQWIMQLKDNLIIASTEAKMLTV